MQNERLALALNYIDKKNGRLSTAIPITNRASLL